MLIYKNVCNNEIIYNTQYLYYNLSNNFTIFFYRAVPNTLPSI